MTEAAFYGRTAELERMDGWLAQALAGRGLVAFISGEPGRGKTALARAFALRAQEQHAGLLVAGGFCNNLTGLGEAYLPFREILATLTGDLKSGIERGLIPMKSSERFKKMVVKSGGLLLDVAPLLIGTLIPGLNLVTEIGKIVLDRAGLEEKLEKAVLRKEQRQALAETTLDQEHIFAQYTEFLSRLSRETPLLLILDDVQWADTSSLNLLFHLGRSLASARVLIVCTFRPDEVALGRDGDRHPFEKVYAESLRLFGEVTIDLDSSSDADERQFVDLLLDSESNCLDQTFRRNLARHTAGNPLFVLELLRSLQERGVLVQDEAGCWVQKGLLEWKSLPGRVQGVIQERVHRLETDLRETLTLASVQGEEFVAEVVARLRQVNERELLRALSEELARRHRLVEPLGIRRVAERRISFYSFQHELIQKYLYYSLDVIQVSVLHEDVGILLEEIHAGATDAVAVQLAWHFAKAGVGSKAAGYFCRAGELAAQAYANEEALQHLTRGLELIDPADAAGRYCLLETRERVFEHLGRRREQAADLEEMARLASVLGDERPAEVEWRRARFALATGAYAEAQVRVEALIRQAEALGDSLWETRGYALLGRVLYHRSAYAEAREWLQLAESALDPAADAGLAARLTYDLGLTDYAQDRFSEALVNFSKAEALYRQLGEGKGQVNCHLMIGTIHFLEDDFGRGREILEEGLVLCRQVGWRRGETYILGNLGSAALNLGDLAAALDYHTRALAICREVEDREGEAVSLDTLGLVHLFRNDLPAAQAALEQALVIDREIGYRRGEGFVLTHLGHCLAALGRPAEAEAAFAEALALRRAIDAGSALAVDDLAGLAEAARLQGNLTQAVKWADEALEWLAVNDPHRLEYPAQAYWLCGRALHAAGQIEQAREAHNAGRQLLEVQAARIQPETLRAGFWENIPFHRALAGNFGAG